MQWSSTSPYPDDMYVELGDVKVLLLEDERVRLYQLVEEVEVLDAALGATAREVRVELAHPALPRRQLAVLRRDGRRLRLGQDAVAAQALRYLVGFGSGSGSGFAFGFGSGSGPGPGSRRFGFRCGFGLGFGFEFRFRLRVG